MALTVFDILAIVLPIVLVIVGWSFRYGKFTDRANRAFGQVEDINARLLRLDTLFESFFERIFPLLERLLLKGTSGNPEPVSYERRRCLLDKAKQHQLDESECEELINLIEKALQETSLDEVKYRFSVVGIELLLNYLNKKGECYG